MKKLVLAVLALLVAGVIALWFSLDRIAKGAVERGATYATGVTTRVGDLRLGLFSGELALHDVRVDNPRGYEAAHIFVLRDLDLGVHPRSLLDDVVRVPRLVINGVHVNLEREAGRANYSEILENVRRLGSDGQPAGAQEQKRFIIDELRIEDVQADAVFAPELGERGRTQVTVPAIALRDVGAKSGGVTIAELTGILSREVMGEVARSGQLPAQFRQQLDAAVGRVQGLEGEARRGVEERRRGLEEEAGRAIEEQRRRLEEEGQRLFD
ncbi:MAG: hypothetical protein AB7U81_09055 [Thiohalomonadaceae bacterium]